jgi:eukaryotic-like serine/threonine-protein kinase
MSGTLPEGGRFAGRYEILEAVGRGGAAVVYRARDRKHDRDVALKVLHPELTHSISAERFAREIGIAAKLTHPHILPLYDSGDDDGVFYYVTPFIQGETLRDRLEREGRLPVREAVATARAAAAALECAHCHGIVHRDIKPENILLIDGQPLVADFGIARVLEPTVDARMTATGMIVGTPAYMSPEQAAGEAAVDHRSDLYSLGCVLYEMIVGEPPFQGATPQAVIAGRFTREAPPIRGRATVPDLLADVVAATLDRDPDRRIQTAAELRGLLESIEPETATVSSTLFGRTRRLPAFRRRARARRMAIGSVVAVLAVGAWLGREYLPWTGAAGGAARVLTLAVLPLANLSGDVNQEFVADGLTDALITDLARLPEINVISRTSVMQYKMMRKPIREIARELNADMIVEGAITRDGDRILITAALVRGRDEHSLWRDSYVGRVEELFTLQRQVGIAVAREVGARITTSATPIAVKPESQEHYLRGASYAAQWRLEEALGSFQRAVEIDPVNAPAYAALARVHYFRSMFGEVAPLEAFSQMRRAASAALAQDPELGEAHGLLALVNTHFDYDWAGAEAHFIRALELSPSNAQVHHDYAHFLLAMGRGPESVEASRRAVLLDPANPMLTSCLGWHSLFDDRFDEALEHAGAAQRMMPSFWGQVVQGWAFTGMDDGEEAIESMRDAVDLAPELAFVQAALAHALGRHGQAAEARALLAELLARAEQTYVSAYDLALVYAGIGENDSAFEWLAKAIAERSMFVVHLTWDARLEPLRGDRRFAELVARLGIPASGVRPPPGAGVVAAGPAGPDPDQRSSSQPTAAATRRLAVRPPHARARVRGVPRAGRVRSIAPARMS